MINIPNNTLIWEPTNDPKSDIAANNNANKITKTELVTFFKIDRNLGLTPTLCEMPNKNIVAIIGVVTIIPATLREMIIRGGAIFKSVMPNTDCNAQANIKAIKNNSNTPCKTAVLVFFLVFVR